MPDLSPKPIAGCSWNPRKFDPVTVLIEMSFVVPDQVTVGKTSVVRSSSAEEAGIACYTMASNPRGLALIIDISKYDNDVYAPRTGSHVSYVLRILLQRNLGIFDIGLLVKLLQNLYN